MSQSIFDGFFIFRRAFGDLVTFGFRFVAAVSFDDAMLGFHLFIKQTVSEDDVILDISNRVLHGFRLPQSVQHKNIKWYYFNPGTIRMI